MLKLNFQEPRPMIQDSNSKSHYNHWINGSAIKITIIRIGIYTLEFESRNLGLGI